MARTKSVLTRTLAPQLVGPEVAHVQTPYGAAGVGLVATVQTLMAH